MNVSGLDWYNTVQSLKVQFGRHANEPKVLGEHEVEKRDSLFGKRSDPFKPPAQAAELIKSGSTTSVAHKSIGHQLTNIPLLPPNVSGIALLDDLPIPSSFLLKCQNCTTTGSIDLLEGSFSAAPNGLDPIASLTSHTFTFVLEATDLGAHIDLLSTIPVSTSLDHTISLPPIPLTRFKLPIVGEVGPIFLPSIVFGARTIQELTFQYGFDLQMPKKFNITLNVDDSGNLTNNLAKSSMKGFSKPKVYALPFRSNATSDMNLELSIGFRAELLLSFGFLGRSVNAGFFMDLPTLAANITSSNVTAGSECEALGHVDTPSERLHIAPEVAVAFGVLAEASIGAGLARKSKKGHTLSHVLTRTSTMLPTACLDFDALTSGYVTQAASVSTGTVRGPVDSKSRYYPAVVTPMSLDFGSRDTGRSRFSVATLLVNRHYHYPSPTAKESEQYTVSNAGRVSCE